MLLVCSLSIQQREAHERPVIFYSLVLGAIGPVMALTVPTIRKNYFGYVQPEAIPVSYPCMSLSMPLPDIIDGLDHSTPAGSTTNGGLRRLGGRREKHVHSNKTLVSAGCQTRKQT